MATKKAVKRVVKKPARKVARKVVKRKAKAVKCTTRQAAVARKVQQAAKLYKAFHGEAPKKITRKKATPTKVGMVLGKLEAVIYETPDGKRYMHKFEGSRPTLAATHDGRQLFVQGGRYRMTARGIVG